MLRRVSYWMIPFSFAFLFAGVYSFESDVNTRNRIIVVRE